MHDPNKKHSEFEYAYQIIECDAEGNPLDTHDFTCTTTTEENDTYTLKCESAITISDSETPAPENLYYRILTGFTLKKIILVSDYSNGHQQENGVEFSDVPVYREKGQFLDFVVSEVPYTGTVSNYVKDYQIYHLYDTVENDTVHYQKNGEKVEERLNQEGSYLVVGGNDRHYCYYASAQAYADKIVSTNSTSSGARAELLASPTLPTTHYNILNTLPLTAVDVVKTWDDQSDKFNLRPYDIADKLHLYTYAVTEDDFTANEDINLSTKDSASFTELVNTHLYLHLSEDPEILLRQSAVSFQGH